MTAPFFRHRATATIGLVLATCTTLAACTSSEGGSAASPSKSAPQPVADKTPTPSPTPDYDVDIAGPWEPGEVTAAGTELAMGEPAWLVQSTYRADGEVEYLVGASLLQILPGDPAIFSEFENSEEFAGYTPYFLVSQFQFGDDLPDDATPERVALFPVKADGTGAEYLLSSIVGGSTAMSVSNNDCGLDLPPYDEATKTLVTCLVAMTNDGQPVTGAAFTNHDFQSSFSIDIPNLTGDVDPYEQNPVFWR